MISARRVGDMKRVSDAIVNNDFASLKMVLEIDISLAKVSKILVYIFKN